MKITELMEATNKLVSYLKKNEGQFQAFGNVYVFLWTDAMLRSLIKAGVNTNDDLSSATTPGEIGIGIVNVATGDICIGAIDSDYDALWASSTDVSDFFVATKNKTLIRLPNRLQNLADMLARMGESEETGGIESILKYIDDEGMEDIDREYIETLSNTDDVKDYLENSINELDLERKNLEPQRTKLVKKLEQLYDSNADESMIETVRRNLDSLGVGKIKNKIRHIQDLLDQEHLFTDGDSEDESPSVEADIDRWTKNFKRDFPNLGLKDAREFDPNL